MSKGKLSDVRLNGTEQLHFELCLKTNSGVKIVTKDLRLRKVTEDELFELRASGKPGFVLKYDYSYFYSQIPDFLRFYFESLGDHLCSNERCSCSRLSAASDCNGGCAKVRDRVIQAYNKPFTSALKASQRIEKYDFISHGFESFNTVQDSLVVLECTQFRLDGIEKDTEDNIEEQS